MELFAVYLTLNQRPYNLLSLSRNQKKFDLSEILIVNSTTLKRTDDGGRIFHLSS